MSDPMAIFLLCLQILDKIGIPLYNQLVELAAGKIPTVEQLKGQSVAIWAKIAEEEAKA